MRFSTGSVSKTRRKNSLEVAGSALTAAKRRSAREPAILCLLELISLVRKEAKKLAGKMPRSCWFLPEGKMV